jgi:hypothetical protein
MHPDHSAGLSDPATGRRYFLNAELVVRERAAHWFDDAAMAKASERRSIPTIQRNVRFCTWRKT